ncbi:MAG: cysteine--tRNA ligase [bacterium]|nr:cysteine--tRNA ligase [bacterium]
MLKFYNSLTHQLEEFKPIKKGKVGLYTCGPTVYNFAHIGNLRTYIFEDVLKRVIRYDGFKVKHVMNITDVGHLTDDADAGEDKMEKGAKREGKTAWEIAEFYTQEFKRDLADLNIIEPNTWCRATDHIKEQIKLIKKLEKRGYTYKTADGIYFDTAKLPDYGKMANLKNQELIGGVRVDIGDKTNITDFALWKFSPKLEKRQMEWVSPWGIGFPGWHIECSAMSTKYLGQPFDIHCGGIDHIPVHHTNEIAQSEAAEGKPLANFWLHGEFLLIDAGKMAKSEGNFITLNTLREKNINPLSYRYFLLQTHYRKQLNFSWEALTAAETGLVHLYRLAGELAPLSFRANPPAGGAAEESLSVDFNKTINNDLNTPEALALIWKALKDKSISQATLLAFDEVLGLKIKENLAKTSTEKIPDQILKLKQERDRAREQKDWTASDDLRKKLENAGYVVKDTSAGTQINKN